MSEILVKQVRSSNGLSARAKLWLKSLGLKGISSQSTLSATPAVYGLLKRTAHLVEYSVKK